MIDTDAAEVATAFRAEAAALSAAMRAVPSAGWDRPTCCPPWTVRDEFAHTAVAVSRTLEMLALPAPPGPPVTAAGYFVADRRFDQAVDAARVDSAQQFAAGQSNNELVDWFDRQWRAVVTAAGGVPGDRLVTTRHGDPMRLTDFQVTRVFELAVHGIDLADALGAPPWLTPEAADIVDGLLLGSRAPQARQVLGTDSAGLIRYATGRTPLTATDRDNLDQLGITWLTLSP
ncbi:maleylpyruvate isomerase family mycothiol-dependent enzyme [Micromonospora sp. CPCC 206061]|uniref:maleylpyruvate isomerase family mycothiol-dependent enzyme n=1 Tax=Micromonospora sp. CPCC 206061 TaxID=3122410 RepID=UPI002FF29E91